MPIHGYPGNIITANPTAPTVTSASGVWTTEQQLQAMAAGNWPMALTQISRSLRFNSADSAYLNRTPASAGSRTTWTWSGWVKRSALSNVEVIFGAQRTSGTDGSQIFFTSSNTIRYYAYNGSSYDFDYVTTQVFRDVSSWYHLVFVLDTTNATSTDRVRMYVNGSRVTAWGTSTAPSQNFSGYINQAIVHNIGKDNVSSTYYLNGYLTEVNFVDGQALTPASFGQTNSSTGVWEPRQYTGPYGTNGFYLNFSDNSGTTSTTLGKDSSGNGNNWTPNNFSVTAGAGNDSMVDSPTSYGTDTGAGGEVRGNYATLSPVSSSSLMTLANGNLDVTSGTTAANGNAYSTISPLTGKFYAEVRVNTGSNADMIGVCPNTLSNSSGRFDTLAGGIGYYYDGQKYVAGVVSNYGSSYTTNDVIGIALDMDAQTVTFYKNNVSQGTISSSMTANVGYYFVSSDASSGNGINHTWNFGQRAFAYTAPSGFKALCTQNLPTPTIGATSTTQANDYFNPVLYTGTGSSLSVTGVGFQPDFTWIKGRSGATDHGLYDAVRGVQKQLESNTTTAETTETTGLTAFGSDGFTVGALAQLNTSTATYVAWNWNAGGSNATNTAGSITSTVRANTTSGFSIVTYTGTGATATVGHGLGVAPSMVIVKNRTTAGESWCVYHVSIGAAYRLFLNTTGAQVNDPTGFMNSTAPTSTVFTVGSNSSMNGSGANLVAYCFAAVAGYSAFGSYTGNGSTDGPFVYTGFRPRFFMTKRTDGAGDNWHIHDTSRSTYNIAYADLRPNTSDAENTSSYPMDILSNGIKWRQGGSDGNESGATYIYAAFAESPFKYALAR